SGPIGSHMRRWRLRTQNQPVKFRKPIPSVALQKNWSLFPGNGFLPAETNAPEWPLTQTSHLKETNHAHETRLIRVIPQQFGKSRFARDCVVGLGGLELSTKRLSPDGFE